MRYVIFALSLLASVAANAQWWAGTIIESSPPAPQSVTMVTGTFVVPEPICHGTQKTSCSIWVGLGGYWDWDQQLPQIGIELNCEQGKPAVRPWYEYWPAAWHAIKGFTVQPGDTLTLTAKYETNDDCQLSIVNHTRNTGWGITKKVNKLEQGSGEWIVESEAGVPLTDFWALIWTDCRAMVNGQTLGIGEPSAHIEQWSQINGLTVLSGTGDSFAVAKE